MGEVIEFKQPEVNEVENAFEQAEDFADEEAELFSELTTALNYAVRVGFCSSETAQDWIAGYENCGDHIEWKRNIVRILMEECMPSGEETQEDEEEVLDSQYLSLDQKTKLSRELNGADPYLKAELLEGARKAIELKKKQEDEFNRLIFKIKLASLKRKLEKEFESADIDEAKKILNKLEQYVTRPEAVAMEMPEEVQKRIEQTIQAVEDCLANKDFVSARQQLDSIGIILNFSSRYQVLSQKIDTQQADSLRQMLKAA